MSFRSYSFRGIGFDLNRADKEDIFAFFKRHEESIPDYIREDIMNVVNDEDSCIYDLEQLSENVCVGEFVADIMNKETEYHFDYIEGNYGEDAVLFPPCYPWEYNKREKNATKEEIVAIVGSYAGEFGLSVDTDMDIEVSG